MDIAGGTFSQYMLSIQYNTTTTTTKQQKPTIGDDGYIIVRLRGQPPTSSGRKQTTAHRVSTKSYLLIRILAAVVITYCNEGERLFSFRQTCSPQRGAYKLPATTQNNFTLSVRLLGVCRCLGYSDGDTCSMYQNITNPHKPDVWRKRTSYYTEKKRMSFWFDSWVLFSREPHRLELAATAIVQ